MEEEEAINLNTSPGEVHKPTFRSLTSKSQQAPAPFRKLTEQYNNRNFYNTGYGESIYDEGLNFDAAVDENDIQGSINEFRSQQQGLLPEIGAGLGRVGTKAGTEIIKTIGALGGTVAGIVGNVGDLVTGEDNTNFLETTFNNDFIKAADKIHQSINAEYLPVYVSETVENGDFFDKVSSPEFWATEGADGVGYLLSALAPGAALKSLGAGNKLFGGLTKLNALKYGQNLEKSREALQALGMTTEGINDLMIPAVNTYFEAGAEAKGVGDSMEAGKNDFINKFLEDKTAFLNNQLSQGLIDQNTYNQQLENLTTLAEQDFNLQKGYAMRNTFLTNLGVLAIPNYIQSKLLFGKNETKNLLNQVKQPVASKAIKRVGEAFLSEGGEEIAQTSVEKRNVERGLKGELSSTALGDFNIGRFSEDFIKTLGTTEGQVAGFLGGVLGSPISVVQGYKQDKRDLTVNDRLRLKIENAGTAFSDVDLPLYQTETSTNPETGEPVEIRVKDENGKDILIPENVARVKEALNVLEDKSKEYDEAVANGDIETVNKLKNESEHALIRDFITEDEVSLDALREHLNTIFPTESKEGSKTVINKENLNRINNIIDQAKYIQKELKSYKDTTASIVHLDNETATDQQIQTFLNQKGNEFLKLSSDKYFYKKQLDSILSEKNRLMQEVPETEEINLDYIEGKTKDIYKTIKVRKDPRLTLLNKQQDVLEKAITKINDDINTKIWNNDLLNKEFDKAVEDTNKINEEVSPEKVNANDNFINTVRSFKNAKDLETFVKTTENKKLLKNTELNKIYQEKKFELEESDRQLQQELENERKAEAERIKAEEKKHAEEEAAKNGQKPESDTQNNNTDDDTNLENDDIDDNGDVIDNTVKEGANKPESEVTTDLEGETKSSKLISTIRDTKSSKNGEPIFEILKPFVEYERTPSDKSNDKFEFQLGDMSFTTKEVEQAYNRAVNGAASEKDIKLLEEQLPIKVNITHKDGQVFTFLPSLTKATKDNADSKTEFELSTLPLRKNIIQGIINNKGFEGLTGTFIKQYPGLLKVESGNTKNNILDLQIFEGMTVTQKLEYFKNNSFYINSKGHFINTTTGEVERIEWNKKGDKAEIKPGRGEIYLRILQNNNEPFFLKLNVNRIHENKADALVLMKNALQTLAPTVDNPQALQSMKIDEFLDTLTPEQRVVIENTLSAEIEFIKELSKVNPEAEDTVERLLDLIVYQKSENPITQVDLIQDQYGDLMEKVLDNNPEDSEDQLVSKFLQLKKYNIIVTKDKANEFVFNNNTYLRYLLGIDKDGTFHPERQVLSTNAVVNQPTFQGYSNIYLSQNINGIKEVKEKTTTLNQAEKEVSKLKEETKKVKDIMEKANDVIGLAESKLTEKTLNSLTQEEFETFVLAVYDNKLSNIDADTFFQGDLLIENMDNKDYRTKFINKLIDLKAEFSEIKKICGK